jgi:hypothetical protein
VYIPIHNFDLAVVMMIILKWYVCINILISSLIIVVNNMHNYSIYCLEIAAAPTALVAEVLAISQSMY